MLQMYASSHNTDKLSERTKGGIDFNQFSDQVDQICQEVEDDVLLRYNSYSSK